MQYLIVNQTTTFNQLCDMVGASNVESLLAVNSLTRQPNIGAQLYNRNSEIMKEDIEVSSKYKMIALGRVSQDSDIFETMALMGDNDWKVYYQTDALPRTLKVPESVEIASSQNTLGNKQRVSSIKYKKAIECLVKYNRIDPEIFNDYSAEKSSKIIPGTAYSYDNLFQFFKIPWGNMSIYSSIADIALDFPVYPEEISDSAHANYTTMPDTIYQYEPWQLYTSSGPRSISYTFTFHRDMWTGDHRDGKANELVRFCMANCYPEYNGSAVNSAITTLYMNGNVLISGVLTDVVVDWSGPLGLDNFYLVCKLTLSFIEVSPYPLNYWSVKSKPLIG